MPEAVVDSKSPKPRRPLSKGDNPPPRHAHFDLPNPKAKPSTTNDINPEEKAPKNTQPDSHPQVGQPPLPNLNRPPSGQWYTAVDPTRSVNLPGAQPAYAQSYFSHPHPQGGHFQQTFVHGGPYQAPNMGDYQNCVPPPMGVNFQPPVPDTTFGPIPHVYVPRFDGVPVYGGGVQVCSPSFLSSSPYFVSAPPSPPTIAVVTPKTFYIGGYNYASARYRTLFYFDIKLHTPSLINKLTSRSNQWQLRRATFSNRA